MFAVSPGSLRTRMPKITKPESTPTFESALGELESIVARMEDGQLSLEQSLTATLQFILHKGKTLSAPRAETPTHYIAMGLNEDLDEAARLATREMVDFLVAEKGLTRDAAYMLCSLAADLHVTQAVDATKGVHATIAKSLFNRQPRP